MLFAHVLPATTPDMIPLDNIKYSNPGNNRIDAIAWYPIQVRCALETATRNSSGDEIANVNFLYDDIVHVAYYKIQVR